MVLAFGRLSVLEICTVMQRSVSRLESPNERVCTIKMQPSTPAKAQKLAGIHKFAPLLAHVQGDAGEMEGFVARAAELTDEVRNLSLSAYDVEVEDYEDLVRGLLDAFKSLGFKKIRLLRPEGNELAAEHVMSREALDVVAFPSGSGFSLGLTSFVPDSAPLKERGTMKPVPHSEISLSPRLAKLLVNLTGLKEGQTLLDPFCGSGTILAEAMLQHLHAVGIDSKRQLVEEARENLQWLSTGGRKGSYKLDTGDARALRRTLGHKRVDGVATEPILLPEMKFRPNIEVAKGLIDEAGSVYAEALASIAEVLRPGGRIAIVVPVLQTTDGNEIFVGLDGRQLGLRLFQPGPAQFQYPVRLSFESTRWIKRAVYVFEAAS